MAELVSDCPRCKAKKTTFDVTNSHVVSYDYGWRRNIEVQSICRHCQRGVILLANQKDADNTSARLVNDGLHELKGNVNSLIELTGFISIRHNSATQPPEHLPGDIDAAFREGANCAAIDCNNAAAAMFRLCIDKATSSLLPEDGVDGLSAKIRRSLGLRLRWLFQNDRLPSSLEDLSEAIREDANDGAHQGTLTKSEAEDLQDFTFALLDRLYSEPAKIQLAKQRREIRRNPPQ